MWCISQCHDTWEWCSMYRLYWLWAACTSLSTFKNDLFSYYCNFVAYSYCFLCQSSTMVLVLLLCLTSSVKTNKVRRSIKHWKLASYRNRGPNTAQIMRCRRSIDAVRVATNNWDREGKGGKKEEEERGRLWEMNTHVYVHNYLKWTNQYAEQLKKKEVTNGGHTWSQK